jgi:hypothetical protein
MLRHIRPLNRKQTLQNCGTLIKRDRDVHTQNGDGNTTLYEEDVERLKIYSGSMAQGSRRSFCGSTNISILALRDIHVTVFGHSIQNNIEQKSYKIKMLRKTGLPP